MIWERDSKLSGSLAFMTNNRSIEIRGIRVCGNNDFMCIHGKSKVLVFTKNQDMERWNWNLCFEFESEDNKVKFNDLFVALVFSFCSNTKPYVVRISSAKVRNTEKA